MARLVWMALLGIGLAGCARDPIPGMELRCQTTKCACVANTFKFPIKPGLNTVPIVWQDNGNASCPEGYVLREAPRDK
ncbi:MAG: hypothetical protein V3U23_01625 [Kiloniellales bacterium]